MKSIIDLESNEIQKISIKPIEGKQAFAYFEIDSNCNSLCYFESGWGHEWTEKEVKVVDIFSFENKAGRSSAQVMPYFTMKSKNKIIDVAIGISGNYKVDFIKEDNIIKVIVSHPYFFETSVKEGDYIPYILVHICENNKDRWIKKQEYTEKMLPEIPENIFPVYNHWWAYEDRNINEEVILKNAKIAEKIGLRGLVLDAGWFGNDSFDEEWFSIRGDWSKENKKRFPSEVKEVSNKVRKNKIQFGIWCEIEGLGKNAEIAIKNEKYIAKRNGENLGYICLASKETKGWAYNILKDLIGRTKSRHFKLDFNLDPGAGCNCKDHDHGENDGLYKHYIALYEILDKLRSEFKDLTIENCSSGGQRFDIEMISHAHVNFLCDPDDIDRHFNCFYNSSLWLHPKRLLHFMWSNTVTTNNSAPFPNLDLSKLNYNEINYYLRSVWMHNWGISHRLPEYDNEILEYLKTQISLYYREVKQLVEDSEYFIEKYDKYLKIFVFKKENKETRFIFSNNEQKIRIKGNLIKNIDNVSLKEFDNSFILSFKNEKKAVIVLSKQ